MSHKPVLVVVTADNCGGCSVFKQRVMSDLVRDAEAHVEVVKINLPSMSSPIPPQYPQDLRRLIAWYPTLILIPYTSWRSGGNMNGCVFNGEITNGRVISKGGGISCQEIIRWVKDECQKPHFMVGPPLRHSRGSGACYGNFREPSKHSSYRGISYRPK